jgi:hypothetical protein
MKNKFCSRGKQFADVVDSGNQMLKAMNGQSTQEASECVAESQGSTLKWGGCQVCSWVRLWVKERELPQSTRGTHAKVSLLLDDPKVEPELQVYL